MQRRQAADHLIHSGQVFLYQTTQRMQFVNNVIEKLLHISNANVFEGYASATAAFNCSGVTNAISTVISPNGFCYSTPNTAALNYTAAQSTCSSISSRLPTFNVESWQNQEFLYFMQLTYVIYELHNNL